MKRFLALTIGLVAMIGTGSSFAVSDGHYDSARQHCSGAADNSDHPTRVEPNCKNFIFSISDVSGHQYVEIAIPQTADGEFANTLQASIDPGKGQRLTFAVSQDGITPPAVVPSAAVSDPSSGLRVYFGADDNLSGGEHDSSDQVNNGPSDGGAIELNVDPRTSDAWVAALQSSNVATLLANPAPLLSAGTGACADGACISLTTHRRVAFKGGAPFHRDIANYAGKVWDPKTCDGGSDSVAACHDTAHPNYRLEDWVRDEGTVYVEPGLQIYEDPDPQASPAVFGFVGVPADDPYPIPAFYVGACGIVFGGGSIQFQDGPYTNSAHQLVIPTACN
jgi:hypothetical protein